MPACVVGLPLLAQLARAENVVGSYLVGVALGVGCDVEEVVEQRGGVDAVAHGGIAHEFLKIVAVVIASGGEFLIFFLSLLSGVISDGIGIGEVHVAHVGLAGVAGDP